MSALYSVVDGIIRPTDAGFAHLSQMVTDTHAGVYSFLPGANPIVIAAAMTRLSRRAGDLRGTILEEFAGKTPEEVNRLFERVVTGYGDDSVQQLFCLPVVVEGASNLLTKKLEWPRLMSYLEQSTRYILFDQKVSGRYLYKTPSGLPIEHASRFEESMDRIFELYSQVVRALIEYLQRTKPFQNDPAQGISEKAQRIAWQNAVRAQACDAARIILPACTTATVGMMGSAQSYENLVYHLLADPLQEMRDTGLAILRAVRQVAPAFFQRVDLPERGGAVVEYRKNTRSRMQALADHLLGGLSQDHVSPDGVTLLDHYPSSEFSLVPEMLFAFSKASPAEIAARSEHFSLSTQAEVIRVYVGERLNRRHKPGRALEKAHFEWLLEIDYGIFRDLQRHRMLDMPEWQNLSAKHGHCELSPLIVEAGLDHIPRSAFELSKRLYEWMVSEGFAEEAQYAVLFGHKVRFRFVANVRELFHLHELRTTPQGHPGYVRVVRRMHELFSEKYPILGEAMRFVGMKDSQDLVRLSSELATARKLEALGY